MGYNHTVAGWDKLEGIINTLGLLEIDYEVTELPAVYLVSSYDHEPRHCRRLTFTHPKTGKRVMAEEYMANKNDDCDGVSYIGVAYHEEGRQSKKLTEARALHAG